MKIYNLGPDELSEYNLGELNLELEWLVVFYEEGCYTGSGEAVGYVDGMLHFKDLGHCSCYGPTSGGFDKGVPVEEFRQSLDSVHGYIGYDVVETKVLKLLG